MDPRDFLETAEGLLHGTKEADWRSSVSRAYYATFNVFCEILRATVPVRLLARDSQKTQMSHGYVTRCLKNCADRSVAELGKLLEELKVRRTDADYKLSLAVDQRAAAEAVEDARDLLAEADSLTHHRIGSALSDHLGGSPGGWPVA